MLSLLNVLWQPGFFLCILLSIFLSIFLWSNHFKLRAVGVFILTLLGSVSFIGMTHMAPATFLGIVILAIMAFIFTLYSPEYWKTGEKFKSVFMGFLGALCLLTSLSYIFI